MWLHPLHTAGGKQPELMLPEDLEEVGADALTEGLAAGLESLAQFVARWTGRRHIDGEPSHKVVLGEAGMYIFMHAKGAATMLPIHVPLLSSCVGHAESSAACAAASSSSRPSTPVRRGRSIILIMPSLEDNCDMIPQAIGPFWLLVLDAAVEDVQGILAAMSQRGALRWDLDQAFSLTSKQLGTGTYSVVYLAHEKQVHKRCVAAKVLNTKSAAKEVLEASFLVSVGWHPHIISFHGIFFAEAENKGSLSWTMIFGWCPRGDLHGELQRRGPFSAQAAAELVRGLLSAIVRVHAAGIVHRDVKAENILLAEDCAPVLSDFGIAARLTDQEAMSRRCGSPGYAAPELLTPKAMYSEKVDVFGVGVVLYLLLSCMLPFLGPDIPTILRRTVKGIVLFDHPPFENVTRQMKQLIADYLKINQDDRPSALYASKLLVLAIPAAASPSSARIGHSRQTSQALTVPCASPAPAAPPIAPAPMAGWMMRPSLPPKDDSTTPPDHKYELVQRRLQPEHSEQPAQPDQPEWLLFSQSNRRDTVATGVMRQPMAPDYGNPGRLDSLMNGGGTSQQQQQQRQSSLPSSGRSNRANRCKIAKLDPITPRDGNGSSGGGCQLLRLMSFRRRPLQFHAGEDGSSFPRSPLEVATASEAASSMRPPTGFALPPSSTQPESTPDDWKSWKSESSEQLGISKLPKELSSSQCSRQSFISNVSSTATASSILKGYASSERSVSDAADWNPSFGPLAHLPEEDSPKADVGEFCTRKNSKAMRPITPSRQPPRQPQTHGPQPPDQPRPRSASSAGGQARHAEGQSVWNRYMPRFLLTPRQRHAASHSAGKEGKEADGRNSAVIITAAAYAEAPISAAAMEPQA